MKVGIVVPYSWSFWGAVVEHAELQADALERLGVETRTIIGHDPPGRFTSALHPRHGRHGRPPPGVLSVGRSVIVPANGTLPNLGLSPSSAVRIKRVRIVGADPLAVRLLLTRERVSDEGIDVLGFLDQDAFTAELLGAKALVAPSLGGESFGMVLTRAFACATPVVASDIAGYRDVMAPEAGVLVPPGDPAALAGAVVALLEDEPGRQRLGSAARELARRRYSWDDIARRLVGIYELVTGRARAAVTA